MVHSADLIPREEVMASQERLAAIIIYKLNQEYSEMCGFMKKGMSLAIVKYKSLLLHGPQDKEAHIWQLPKLTNGAVVALITPCRG